MSLLPTLRLLVCHPASFKIHSRFRQKLCLSCKIIFSLPNMFIWNAPTNSCRISYHVLKLPKMQLIHNEATSNTTNLVIALNDSYFSWYGHEHDSQNLYSHYMKTVTLCKFVTSWPISKVISGFWLVADPWILSCFGFEISIFMKFRGQFGSVL